MSVLCLVIACGATAAFAEIGQTASVKVSFEQAGRISVVAENATLGEILDEWSKVGGARLVASQLPAERRTVTLLDADEREALDTLLQGVPGFVTTKRAEVVAGQSRFLSLNVLGHSVVGPNAPQPQVDVPAPETVFEYASPSGVRFPVMPDLPARDPKALDFGTLPEGVIPEAVYDYALPSGDKLLLPPGVEAVRENATAPADQPMPEMRFQYSRPTPQLQDGSVAPPLFWSAVADVTADATTEQPARAGGDPDSPEPAVERPKDSATGAVNGLAAPAVTPQVDSAETKTADPKAAEGPSTSSEKSKTAAKTAGEKSQRPVTRRKPGGGR